MLMREYIKRKNRVRMLKARRLNLPIKNTERIYGSYLINIIIFLYVYKSRNL